MKNGTIFKKIIGKIAPPGMSANEYVLKCVVNGIDASPSNFLFVEWLIREALSVEDGLHVEVGKLIAECLEKEGMLGLADIDGDADRLFSECLADYALGNNKEFKSYLFRAILRTARFDSKTRRTAYTLNKAFGLTDSFYFSETKEYSSIF